MCNECIDTAVESAEQAVRKGIALLDEKVPDWRSKIDWREFDIAYADKCVLGQVFGWQKNGDSGFEHGLIEFGLACCNGTCCAQEGKPSANLYGFTTSCQDDHTFEQLQDAWIKLATPCGSELHNEFTCETCADMRTHSSIDQ